MRDGSSAEVTRRPRRSFRVCYQQAPAPGLLPAHRGGGGRTGRMRAAQHARREAPPARRCGGGARTRAYAARPDHRGEVGWGRCTRAESCAAPPAPHTLRRGREGTRARRPLLARRGGARGGRATVARRSAGTLPGGAPGVVGPGRGHPRSAQRSRARTAAGRAGRCVPANREVTWRPANAVAVRRARAPAQCRDRLRRTSPALVTRTLSPGPAPAGGPLRRSESFKLSKLFIPTGLAFRDHPRRLTRTRIRRYGTADPTRSHSGPSARAGPAAY